MFGTFIGYSVPSPLEPEPANFEYGGNRDMGGQVSWAPAAT